MINEHTVKLQFPSQEVLDVFWGWFLDGGGDNGLIESLSMEGHEVTHDWDREAQTMTFTHREEKHGT